MSQDIERRIQLTDFEKIEIYNLNGQVEIGSENL